MYHYFEAFPISLVLVVVGNITNILIILYNVTLYYIMNNVRGLQQAMLIRDQTGRKSRFAIGVRK